MIAVEEANAIIFMVVDAATGITDLMNQWPMYQPYSQTCVPGSE